ncbi:MAG: PepSY domain-containing protein [Chitinophagaceae bacterium]|nr:PepSY domain-containing protein [Chitinophagaceae bacterium]MCA6459767.1 PepSY domain-containing protein [Chitinophagaceae bacterium]MCA6466300.1 PepSY domain-containing protein [Chitinophagaceae bacterium]
MVRKGKIIFSWHHWCGLIAGIFLLIMSISGATLVFTQEIEKAYEQPWSTVENPGGAYAYDASFFTVQKLYPGWEIRLSGQPGLNEAVVYDLRKDGKIKKVFAHPLTGALLHISDGVQSQLQRQLLTLHSALFAGTTGKIVIFFVGILFFVSLVTGIYIYRKALIKVLLLKVAINRKSQRTLYSSLHRIIGVWSLLFNLLIVVTGLFISGNIALTAFNKTKAKTENTDRISFSVDKMKKEIQEKYPEFTLHFIRVAANSSVVQLSGKFENDPFYYGKYNSRFTYDGTAGKLLKSERLRDQRPWKKWEGIIHPLHFGNYGGLPVKLLYGFLGLMPGFLSISGFIVWRKKRKTDRVRKRIEVV